MIHPARQAREKAKSHLIPESERPPLPDPNDPASAAKYAAAIGVKLVAPTNLPPEVERQRALNGKHFISRAARSARVYAPDLARLATVTSRLVLAGGEKGRPFIAYRCAAKAAERLGVPLVEFPGDHAAPSLASPRFVEKLRAVLAWAQRDPVDLHEETTGMSAGMLKASRAELDESFQQMNSRWQGCRS